MTLTLLLDLDDTLLVNDIDKFLPAYIQALSQEMAPLVDPMRFTSSLMAATNQMVKNRQPDCTLKSVFDAAFYPALGTELAEVRAAIDRFYSEVFPTLQNLTQPRPAAVQLVNIALERGYRLAIATNPLFPRTAIEQRLAWAGLPVSKFPFDLVSSYESFHFAKPDPAYFAEVLSRLGWPDGPVITVGDSLENDIRASRLLGLPAYWVCQPGAVAPTDVSGPSSSGSLDGLLAWLDHTNSEMLLPDFNSYDAMLAILRSTPATLQVLFDRLDAISWKTRPEPTSWALSEIQCHLRDVDEEVNLPRVRQVLTEDNPFIPGMDTDPWAEERAYLYQDGQLALQRFIAARMEMLHLLEGVPQQAWNRPARHAIFGPTTMAELVNINASHDRLHIRQAWEACNQLNLGKISN